MLRKRSQKKQIEDQEASAILEKNEIIEEERKMEENNEVQYYQTVYGGWNNVDECAATVWSSIHSSLLDGELIFAYKSTSNKSELQQFVLVKNLVGKEADIYGNFGTYKKTGYALGMITSGFSVLYPYIPEKYLLETGLDDLKKYKVPSDVIRAYVNLVNAAINKYGNEEEK
jgi:hypothetical protein